MKKTLVLVLVVLMVAALAFAGCGQKPAEPEVAPEAGAEGEAAPAPEAEGEAAPAPEASGEVSSEWSGLPAEVTSELPWTFDAAAIAEKGYEVGFAQCVMDHPYRLDMVDRAQKWCDEMGVKMIMMDGEGDTAKEVSNVESLISMGVDGIVLSSHGGVALTPAMKQAAEMGIPVVLLDGGKPFDDWEFLCWMSSDDYAMGLKTGEQLVADLGGKGKVAELQGTAGSSCAIGRNGGLNEMYATCDIELVYSQDCNWLRANAVEVVTALLQSHPDLAAVVGQNDELALGAIEAIEAAGKVPGKDILVYSCGDYQANAFEAIEAGKLVMTNSYHNDGDWACAAIIAHLEGQEVPRLMNLGFNTCTIDNVATETPAY